jgi:uncharacterized protein YbcI
VMDAMPVSTVRGEAMAAISTGLVQLHSRYFGKGPTKAKTYLVDDTVICLLRGGFTRVEETLIETGNVQAVYDIRRSFQAAMKEHFTRVVEEAAGRKVIAYMSQIHHDPDVAMELFVLEPDPGRVAPGASEASLDGRGFRFRTPGVGSQRPDPDREGGAMFETPETPVTPGEETPEEGGGEGGEETPSEGTEVPQQ